MRRVGQQQAEVATPRPTAPARATYAVAAAATAVLLALSTRYGPHRDELYFVAAGHHPQWGYPDQPPLTPLVAAAADTLAPGSLLALRTLSAVIVGVVVLLTADLARALGGDRGAQLLAAVATATGAGVLAIGHLLSTATLDLLAWTVVIRLAVATLQRDRPRLRTPSLPPPLWCCSHFPAATDRTATSCTSSPPATTRSGATPTSRR